jgi:AraC family transcriptional regulator
VSTAAEQAHRLDCSGPLAQLYFDPEGTEGLRLSQTLRGSGVRAVRLPRAEQIGNQLGACWKDGWPADRCQQLVDRIVQLVVPGDPPKNIDARVMRSLELLRASSARSVPLAALAAQVSLSPSRLAHLFRANMGLPVRRYLLWLRLNDAISAMSQGANITQAAHDAGFSDSAHLTRTFRRMFGMPPSRLRSHTAVTLAD